MGRGNRILPQNRKHKFFLAFPQIDLFWKAPIHIQSDSTLSVLNCIVLYHGGEIYPSSFTMCLQRVSRSSYRAHHYYASKAATSGRQPDLCWLLQSSRLWMSVTALFNHLHVGNAELTGIARHIGSLQRNPNLYHKRRICRMLYNASLLPLGNKLCRIDIASKFGLSRMVCWNVC